MNLANRLTIFRIFLTPLFAAALVYYSSERILLYWVGTGIFALACLTDALDGYVAAKMNQKTVLGSYIDPIADKLLLLSGYVCLGFLTHLPPTMKVPAWLTILVISRDILIVLGSMVIFVMTGALKARPLFVGKLTTVLQMATLLASLLMLPELFREVLFGITGLLTVVTGFLYVKIGSQALQGSGK